jgi:acyl-CoA thioester hydrolase
MLRRWQAQVDAESTACRRGDSLHEQELDAQACATDAAAMTDRRPPERRDGFRWFTGISLRWNDIDVLGHVNNARYYEFFDSTVLGYLHERELGFGTGGTLMVVAENGCRFHREIVFTDRLEMGLRVDRIGTSSVRYRLGAFVNDAEEAAADGHFVHVFIDPESKRPAPFSGPVREHLEALFDPTA